MAEKKDTTNAIHFTQAELSRMKGHRLIHNHPSGSTLSLQDVRLALEHGLKEIVAFSGKGIYFRLIIKSKIDVNELLLQYNNAKKRASEAIYKLVLDGVFTIKCTTLHSCLFYAQIKVLISSLIIKIQRLDKEQKNFKK